MSSSSETYTPLNLVGGGVMPFPTIAIILALAQDLVAGTVLGRILRALGATTAGSNTGEGDIADEDLGPNGHVGVYRLTCTAVGTPAIFSVVDPNGNRLADATAEVPYVGEICFEINASGTGFAVGDSFTIEVEEGSRECVIADSSGVDGSETLYGILAEDADATSGALDTVAYLGGEFSEDACTFTYGDDADTWRDQARDLGIIFRTNVSRDEA